MPKSGGGGKSGTKVVVIKHEPKPEPIAEPKPEPIVEPKPETVIDPKPESIAEPKPETVIEPKPEQEVIDIKPKKSAEELKRQEQIEQAQLDLYQGTDLAQVAKNILYEKPIPQPIDFLGNIDLSKPLNKMTEKELLFEYKALKNAVKNMNTTDPAAQRFLEIQGELINKRAYRITKDGNVVKRQNALDEYTKQGLEFIDKQEAEAKKAIEESNARNAELLAEQNAKREAEYEKMFLKAEAERNARFAKEEAEKQVSLNQTQSPAKPNNTEFIGRTNELPESFNQEQLTWMKAHGFIKDKDIFTYPKLFSDTHGKIKIPINLFNKAQINYFLTNGFIQKGEFLELNVSKSLPKDKKTLAKIMKKLYMEHKERRMQEVSQRIGIYNDTVLYNPVAVPDNIRYNYKKYESMAVERRTNADWEPEMTREEFIRNIEKYMNEEIKRTTPQKHYTNISKKESLLEKLKRKIGL